jgi:acid phosphatase type 7
VQYGLQAGQWTHTVNGSVWKFRGDGNPDGLQFMNRVDLVGLTPGTRYFYSCISGTNTSDVYSFTTMRDDLDWSPTFLVVRQRARPLCRRGTAAHHVCPTTASMVIWVSTMAVRRFHVSSARSRLGRFLLQSMLATLRASRLANSCRLLAHPASKSLSYDMQDDGGVTGDIFMNQIQPFAANVPLMTCPGNHEIAFNFSNYINRFNMPLPENADPDTMWFSWDIARVHFISYSTEVFFTDGPVQAMMDWLKQDLASANANRESRPWIVAYGHRCA